MKKALFILSCMALFCLHPVTTMANYAAGGELIYEWITGTTYRFYFKLYRDCGGISEPITLPLCFSNSCNTSTFSTSLTKYGSPVPPYKFQCAQLQTKCDNPSAALPGYQEVWYYADVALPFQCNSWKAFTYLSTRKTSNNIANASSTNMYIEVYFNNTGTFEGNSSPYYSNKPFLNPCQNTPFTFNNGAVDPNMDSLVTEVIQPLTGASSCSGSSSAAAFDGTTPAFSIPSNPIQSNNSFTINAQTGLINVTPTQAGVSTLAVRTKEYRNGVLIGTIMREMPVNVYSCPATQAIPVVIPDGSSVSGGYATCSGQTLNFSFDVKISTAGSPLYVTQGGIPGAVVSYANQGTDSVRGNFSWTPAVNISGAYNLLLTVRDSTCAMPGIVYSYTYAIPVHVWNTVTAGTDTAVCSGTPVTLKYQVPGSYTWTVISGDVNSLSCTGCNQPTVTPTIPSQYELIVNGLPAGCPPKRDTVTVDMLPYNKPNLSIAASPGNNVWPWVNVTFTATSFYCDTPQYQWRINGNSVPGETNATFNTTTLGNNDVVTCLLTCSDTCIIDTPSNAITMNVATSVGNVSSAGGSLYPNPNEGSFVLRLPNHAKSVDLTIVNILGQSVWQQLGMKTGAGNAVTIDAAHLPAGQYILKAGYDDKTETLRFVISR